MSRKPRIPDDKRAKILDLYRAGEKVSYIAFALDVSLTAVCKIANTAGLVRGRGGHRPTRTESN